MHGDVVKIPAHWSSPRSAIASADVTPIRHRRGPHGLLQPCVSQTMAMHMGHGGHMESTAPFVGSQPPPGCGPSPTPSDTAQAPSASSHETFSPYTGDPGSVPTACIDTDTAGVILLANDAARQMLDRADVELVGRPLATLVCAEDRVGFRRHLAHMMYEPSLSPWVLNLQDGSHAPRPVQVVPAALRDVKGRRVGIRWFLSNPPAGAQRGEPAPALLPSANATKEQTPPVEQHDQPGRPVADSASALQAEKRILQTLIDNTQTQLAYLDAEFRHVCVNAAYARAVGREPTNLIGVSLLGVVPDAEMRAALLSVRESGGAASSTSCSLPQASQLPLRPTCWEWCLVPVQAGSVPISGYVLSLTEVSSREYAKRQHERHRNGLALLVRASQRILAETSVDELLRCVGHVALDLTDAALSVASHTVAKHAHMLATATRTDSEPVHVVHVGHIEGIDPFLHDLKAHGPIRWTQTEFMEHPAWQSLPENHPTVRGLLAAPLVDRQGELLGAIMASGKLDGEFDESDEALLVELATMTSLSLQHVVAREEAERRAEELAAVFAAMSDAVLVWDAQGTVISANPAATAMLGADSLGLKCDDILRRMSMRRLDGTPLDVADLPCSRALAGRPTAAERLLFENGGRELVVEVSASPIYAGGKLVGAVSLWHDITEQERAAQAIRRYAAHVEGLYQIDSAVLASDSPEEIANTALRHLRALVPFHHASVAAFSLYGSDARVLAIAGAGNRALAAAWHSPLAGDTLARDLAAGHPHIIEDVSSCSPRLPLMDMAETFGIRAIVSIPLLAKSQLLGSLDLGFAQPGAPSGEHQEIIREVANQIALGIRLTRLHDGPQEYASHLEDQVVERTEQLHESEVRFQAIFRQSAIGMAVLDLDGCIMESNPALLVFSGYDSDSLVGKPLQMFFAPEDRGTVVGCVSDLSNEAPSREWIDARLMRRSGDRLWVSLTASLILKSNSEPSFILLMMRDATEQRETQAALIRSEKLAVTGRLASSLIHEINNPLQAVIGCLGLAEETLAEGGDVRRYLQVARDELQRAARIVADLRDLRPHPATEERRPTDLRQLVDQVLTLVSKQCRDNAITVEWDPSQAVSHVPAVPERIQQVLLNLVLNAIDAMPAGGQLSLGIAETDVPHGVRVTVTDTGKGIPADALPFIFDPFITTKENGLGLGLFICQNIAHDHGGTIEATSALERGTTFSLWLPAR
ncbi:MAG: PAS domain S-box protein [Anaerolineae bacterium]